MRTETHAFTTADLVGGDLALDLVNTVTARDTTPRDWLPDYASLLRWARASGAFVARDLATLDRLAAASPHKARAALVRIRAFRESLCTALYALVRGREPAAADLERLQAAHASAATAAHLQRREGRVVRRWSVAGSQLDLILHIAATRSLALLEDVEPSRLRVCDGHDCGWVFVDTSKSGRRRWCDMATCGNTAKAQRFQRRQAAA